MKELLKLIPPNATQLLELFHQDIKLQVAGETSQYKHLIYELNLLDVLSYLTHMDDKWYVWEVNSTGSMYSFDNYEEVINYSSQRYGEVLNSLSWTIIKDILLKNSKLFIHTTVFESLLGKSKDNAWFALNLFKLIESGAIKATASVISLYEVLATIENKNDHDRVNLLLTKLPNLSFSPVDSQVVKTASRIKGNVTQSIIQSTLFHYALASDNVGVINVSADPYNTFGNMKNCTYLQYCIPNKK